MSAKKKCVLAYSGGLDTSAIVVWLVEQGYEVHAVLVDVGQDEDLEGLCEKAFRYGAASAIVCDAKPAMFEAAIPIAVGLAATYETDYRLGTALARPFIALEQVRLAKLLGGATLVHGATGKGNDQIRFEFAYRSLAPECSVLAPWKTWEFSGRQDLIDYLQSKGFDDDYEVTKDYSLDENLWHLSVEGGALEDPQATVDIAEVLQTVSDRFAIASTREAGPSVVEVEFKQGVPVALNGERMSLQDLILTLNQQYRHANWAWDLVIENRFTGIKSRGLYINPAAKLLHLAVTHLARCCLNKPAYDRYVELGREYGALLYRGEYFADQRVMAEAAAGAVMKNLSGAVTVQLEPAPYVSRIDAKETIFREDMATFEASEYSHADAQGFINLSWLSSIGRPFAEETHGSTLETGPAAAPDVRGDEQLPERRLVSAPV